MASAGNCSVFSISLTDARTSASMNWRTVSRISFWWSLSENPSCRCTRQALRACQKRSTHDANTAKQPAEGGAAKGSGSVSDNPIIGTSKNHPTVLWPELRSRKKAVRLPCDRRRFLNWGEVPAAGKTSSAGCCTTRSRYERGGSPSGTVWCAKTLNAVAYDVRGVDGGTNDCPIVAHR